jgi:hypothetical protein
MRRSAARAWEIETELNARLLIGSIFLLYRGRSFRTKSVGVVRVNVPDRK